MRRLFAPAVVSAVVAAAALLAAEGGPADEVSVVALEIVKPLPGDKARQSLTKRRTGTALTLSVSQRGRHLLGLDRKACEVLSFTDDRGTSLISESAKLLRTWLDGRTWVSEDGRRCLFEILSTRTPRADARQVKLRARLAFRCGLRPVTRRQANCRLRKDVPITVSPVPMKVTEVQFGPKSTIVTLSARERPDSVASITFVDLDGTKIEAEHLGSSVVGFMDNAIYEQTFGLKKGVETVNIDVKYFEKIERITLTADVSAGVGF